MKSRLALFPAGPVGAGLLLLRLALAASVLGCVENFPQGVPFLQVIAALAAAGVCAGLQTRILAVICMPIPLLGLAVAGSPLGPAVSDAISAMALAMTGPGAFSVDARLFGRRTIKLPNRDDSIV